MPAPGFLGTGSMGSALARAAAMNAVIAAYEKTLICNHKKDGPEAVFFHPSQSGQR